MFTVTIWDNNAAMGQGLYSRMLIIFITFEAEQNRGERQGEVQTKVTKWVQKCNRGSGLGGVQQKSEWGSA